MRLPVSDLDVSFHLPDGHDDLAILEAGGEGRRSVLEEALEALCRLATFKHSTETRSIWMELTVTDFEHALLGLRRFLFGDAVHCLVRCRCSERMEMELSIGALLREASPHTPRHVLPSDSREGWYRFSGKDITFRLPSVADQIEALASSLPYALLKERCIERISGVAEEKDPQLPHTRSTGVAERAMEAMAPTVSRPVTGVCAACGTSMTLQLHVPSLVLRELRTSSASIHSEIHVIAATYHWQESAILALPQLRRQAYTEAIRNGGAL
jgi:hypothetical protein